MTEIAFINPNQIWCADMSYLRVKGENKTVGRVLQQRKATSIS